MKGVFTGTMKLLRDKAFQDLLLMAFTRFVQENAAHITAIGILLNRPQQWGTDALVELRQTLATTPQRFTIESLQRVHAARYHKALVDIISMVKHAARDHDLKTVVENISQTVISLYPDVCVGRTLWARSRTLWYRSTVTIR